MVRILLADEQTLVREGLRRLIEDNADLTVVGEAVDGHTALRLWRQLRPHVTVLALALPRLDGIEVTKRILKEDQGAKVLILTIHATEDYAARALRAGARGFLGKCASGQDVLAAIRAIAAGRSFLSPTLRDVLPNLYVRDASQKAPLTVLSDRELQILKRIAEGRSLEAIAKEIHVSGKTVEACRSRLLKKLQLGSTAELIRLALRERVIEDLW
jgi:DNA-binding NarL/FixJ family response regulator